MTRELSPMEKEVQDHITDILRDIIEDNKRIIKRMQATIILLILLLAATFVYYEWNFKAFMSQYDYESTITTKTTTDNNSKINNSQNTNAQNNIQIDFPKNIKER